MKNTLHILSAPVCFALLLSACATTQAPSSTLGQAVKANIQQQAIVPTDAEKANTFIPADKARQALAQKKYRENKVEKPKPFHTSQTP